MPLTQKLIDGGAKIRQQLDNDLQRIRNDRSLSSTGRAQQVARAWKVATAGMEGLRINTDGAAALTAFDVKRKVFGSEGVTGADAISQRDAADRAAQLRTGDEALALLHRAEYSGDSHMAKAVAAHAFDQASSNFIGSADWSKVLDAYTTTRPEVAQQLQELADSQRSSVADSLQVAGHNIPGQAGRDRTRIRISGGPSRRWPGPVEPRPG